MALTGSTYSGGILTSNYDTSKVFIYDNSFEEGQINNDDYADLVLVPGTLLGRISATGMLIPLASGASDGSQFPVGVLANDLTIEYGATANVTFCVAGEVNANNLVLQGSDTLDTVISGRRLRDRIGSDTAGVVIKSVNDLSKLDNQ